MAEYIYPVDNQKVSLNDGTIVGGNMADVVPPIPTQSIYQGGSYQAFRDTQPQRVMINDVLVNKAIPMNGNTIVDLGTATQSAQAVRYDQLYSYVGTGGTINSITINNSTISGGSISSTTTISVGAITIHDCVRHDQITEDQANTATGQTLNMGGGVTERVGQTFIAGVTKQLTHCELYITKSGTPTDAVYIGLYNVSAGLPTGSPRIYSAEVQARDIVDGAAQGFFFPRYAPSSDTGNWLIAGNVYAIVLFRRGAPDNSNYYQLTGSTNQYTNGQAVVYSTALGWAVYPGSGGRDLQFATYYGETIETNLALDQLAPANGILPPENLGTGDITGGILVATGVGTASAWTNSVTLSSINGVQVINGVAVLSTSTGSFATQQFVIDDYVPYTGATDNVEVGTYGVYGAIISSPTFYVENITGTAIVQVGSGAGLTDSAVAVFPAGFGGEGDAFVMQDFNQNITNKRYNGVDITCSTTIGNGLLFRNSFVQTGSGNVQYLLPIITDVPAGTTFQYDLLANNYQANFTTATITAAIVQALTANTATITSANINVLVGYTATITAVVANTSITTQALTAYTATITNAVVNTMTAYTATMTNVVITGTPALPHDAVTIEYVQNSIGISLNYWLQASNVLGQTYAESVAYLTQTPTSSPETLSDVYFKSAVLATPTPFTIKNGTEVLVHFKASVNTITGVKLASLVPQLFYVDADGTSNPVQIGANGSTTGNLTATNTQYETYIPVANEVIIPAGKRLWVKFIATSTGASPTYPAISVEYGDIHDHLTIPVSGSILGRFLQVSQNLADVAAVATARYNLGIGTTATVTLGGVVANTITGTAIVANTSITTPAITATTATITAVAINSSCNINADLTQTKASPINNVSTISGGSNVVTDYISSTGTTGHYRSSIGKTLNGGNDSYVVSLLHLDGADGSTTFTDATGLHSWTALNQAQIDTAQQKFGTASLLCDGTTDCIYSTDHADWDFGAGDFTIDFWVRFNSDTNDQGLFAQKNASGYSPCMLLRNTTTDKLNLYTSTTGISWSISGSAGATTINTGAWYHVAVVRNGDVYRLFVNGLVDLTVTQAGTLVNSNGGFSIGSNGTDGAISLNGWIDEFRITKGYARWTQNFPVPTAAYANDADATRNLFSYIDGTTYLSTGDLNIGDAANNDHNTILYGRTIAAGSLTALATTATKGFFYIPTCAGAPTGIPEPMAGKVAMVYDTTNNEFYIYNSGWKSGAAFS